jgi:hypothetical protein
MKIANSFDRPTSIDGDAAAALYFGTHRAMATLPDGAYAALIRDANDWEDHSKAHGLI